MRLIVLFLLIPFVVFGQKYDGICHTVNKLGMTITKFEFYAYKNETFINEKYGNIREVTNSTPEELLKSQLSVTNNDWLSLNYGKTMNWSKEQFEKLNNPANKIELLCKLNIKVDDIDFSIFKMNLYNKQQPISIYLLMRRQINNKWIISENNIFSNLGFIIMFTSLDDLYYAFNNKPNSSNQKINALIRKSWQNSSIIDLNMFINEMGGLLMNSEYEKYPYFKSIKIEKDEKTIIKTQSNIPYSNQSFCYYFENENSTFDDNLTSRVSNYVKNKNIDSRIFPLALLSFDDIDNQRILFFKYKIENAQINRIENAYLIDDLGVIKKTDIKGESVINIFEKDSEYLKKYFDN
jgi:hypothetical protein